MDNEVDWNVFSAVLRSYVTSSELKKNFYYEGSQTLKQVVESPSMEIL